MTTRRFEQMNVVVLPSSLDPLFRVTFDWFTPRPHFIVLNQEGISLPKFDASTSLDVYEKVIPDFVAKLVAAAEWTFNTVRMIDPSVSGPDQDQTVDAAVSVVTPSGDVSNYPIVLSIHRGRWINSQHFHAHVCTNTSGYLGVIENLKSNGVLPEDIPGEYVTQTWDHKPPLQHQFGKKHKPDAGGRCYDRSVCSWPSRASKHFSEDLKAIDLSCTSAMKSIIREQLIKAVQSEAQRTSVSYHKRFARLGFDLGSASSARASEKVAILTEMEQIATRLFPLMKEVVQDKFSHGCHLCISLGVENNQGFLGFQRLVGEKWQSCSGVYGYIQLAAPVFYELLPDDVSRHEWYERFKVSKEAVMT